MTFIVGKDVKVFITTEYATAGIMLTGSAAASTASMSINDTSSFGIPKLGSVTATTSTNCQFKNVEGVDVATEYVDENTVLIGAQQELDIPLRKKWNISITRKVHNRKMGNVMDARHGCKDSTTTHPGTEEYDDNTGYRIYLYTAADGQWSCLYHGVIESAGYSVAVDPSKTLVETIKFKGNDYDIDVPTGSLTTSRTLT